MNLNTTMTIKRGDLEPPLRITCYDGAVVKSLEGAESVRILLRGNDDFLVDDISPDLSDAADGVAVHQWVAGETDTAQTLRVECEVTWPTARPQTYPPSGYLTVNVVADLG